MERGNSTPACIVPGTLVTLVTFDSDQTHAAPATVRSIEPLIVNLEHAQGWSSDQTILLITQTAEAVARTHARFLRGKTIGTVWAAELEVDEWQVDERRRTVRQPCRYTAGIRILPIPGHGETTEDMVAEFTDIGIGGGWVQSPCVLPTGSLLRWKLAVPTGNFAEGLALVASSSTDLGGMGLEFVELFGDSKHVLADLIEREAA